MVSREPSLGEIADRLDELKSDFNSFSRNWENRHEELRKTFVSRELYEARHLVLQERIAKLELKEQMQDEAIKKLEDAIDERFSRTWTALVSLFIAPIVVSIVLYLLFKGQ